VAVLRRRLRHDARREEYAESIVRV
jgi:hypothetical protein